MTYFKVRNDISVATLTRIVCSMYESTFRNGLGLVIDINVLGEKDLRLRLLPPRDKETYEVVLEDIRVVDLPRGALKIMEED